MKERMPWFSGLLVLSLVLPLCGQRILGEFTGTVTDPSQAAVAGAKVVAVDAATGRSWTAQTNESGVYRLVSLPAGSDFEVRLEQPGFKTAKQQRLTLDVGEVKRLDFVLELGD